MRGLFIGLLSAIVGATVSLAFLGLPPSLDEKRLALAFRMAKSCLLHDRECYYTPSDLPGVMQSPPERRDDIGCLQGNVSILRAPQNRYVSTIIRCQLSSAQAIEFRIEQLEASGEVRRGMAYFEPTAATAVLGSATAAGDIF